MVGSGAREDVEVRAGIAHWLDDFGIITAGTHEIVGGPFTIGPLSRPATGLSSDTSFVTATTTDGQEHDLVVRLAPAGDGLFRRYDLGAQVLTQNALDRSGIPTAAPARFEADRSWLGDPFMVMPRIPGRVVDTRPSYLQAGWLADSDPSFQTALLEDFLHTLAELHQLNPAFDAAAVSVADAFAGACDYLDWAATGGEIPKYLVEARAWCSREVPVSTSSTSVLWGDVQFANCVFTEAGAVAALLDFELAGAGPAEMDLGWFLALHDMTANLAGGDLPGFGDRRSMVASYETALGRGVESLEWYEMFALLRSGSIMVRMARLLSRQGIDDGWLHRDNPTEAAVARVLART